MLAWYVSRSTIKLEIPIDSASAIAIRSLLLIRWPLLLPAAEGVGAEIEVGVDELAKNAGLLSEIEIEVDSEENAKLDEIDIEFEKNVRFKNLDVESDENIEADEVEEKEREKKEAKVVFVNVDFEEVSDQDNEINRNVLLFAAEKRGNREELT